MSVRLLFELVVVLLFFNLDFITTTNLRKPIPNLPIPSPPSPSPPTNENETCFEYKLENECSSLLGDVNVNSTIQHILFDVISLNVSDIRMIPSGCRRPLLWFVCGLVFPCCPSETIEEQLCRQVEGCYQVNERCEPFDLSFDCLFPSFEEEDEECSTRISKEIEEATENGIKVETCLGEQKETIECCPDPFIVDFEGECVVECPQYAYGERYEESVDTTLFVLLWVGVLIVFVTQYPHFMMSLNTRYPAYILLFAFIANLFTELIFSLAFFAGGRKEWVCGNEENYFIALNEFGKSRRAGIQMSFLVLFINTTITFWALQSFTTFCFVAKTKWKFFGRFVEHPVSKSIQICMGGACFFIPFALYLFFVIFFFTHDSPFDDVYVAPVAFVSAAVPIRDPLYQVYRVYGAIFTSFVTLIFICSTTMVLLVNFRIFYLQWRGLFVQLYFFVAYGFFLWLYVISDFDPVVFDYIGCVASHPRFDPPPCEKEPGVGRIMYLFTLLEIYLFPIIICSVIFLTDQRVYYWWKELFFNQRVIHNLAELDDLILTRSSGSIGSKRSSASN